MQTYKEAEQLSMFGQDLWYGRTYPAPSARSAQGRGLPDRSGGDRPC